MKTFSLKVLALALCIGASVVFAGEPVHAQAKYSVILLPPLPGGLHADCYGLNDLGYVVGNTAFIGAPPDSATIWRTELPERIGLDFFTPRSLNVNSEIAGELYNEGQAVVWAQGAVQRLTNLLGLPNSVAYGINGSGMVVGYCYDPTGTNQNRGRATRWMNGQPTEIPSLPNRPYAIALAISNSGQAVGYAEDKTGVFRGLHAFSWTEEDGTLDLQTFNGGTTTIAYAVNNVGQVVGWGDTPLGPRAFIWSKATGLKSLETLDNDGYSEAFGVNDAGQVVGNSYGLEAGQWQPHPFIWKDGEYFKNLNDLIEDPTNVWRVAFAQAINNQGQVLCRGYRLDAPLLGSQYLLLTPTEYELKKTDLRLTDNVQDPTRVVVGILCDNVRSMPEDQKNSLKIASDYLVGATDIQATITNDQGTDTDNHNENNVGTIKAGPSGSALVENGTLTYYPPDEFNFEQHPADTGEVTSSATRAVHIKLRFRQAGRQYVLNDLAIVLARPPVVLVHGINSTPAAWNPLIAKVTQPHWLGVSVPFVAVNHNNPKTSYPLGLDGGNGPVEIGAWLLQRRICTTLEQVRRGTTITDEDENRSNILPVFDQVHRSDLYAGQPLAAKRVDVVAWSYGGLITRWYLAANGPTNLPAGWPWYRRMLQYDVPLDTAYQGDVRKVITLGSMWRGVPLANYANEVWFDPDQEAVQLGDAPFLGLANLNAAFGFLAVHPPILRTRVPSMEVMAVNSPWLSHLIYRDPRRVQGLPARPFIDHIAYGSVAGNDDAYLPPFGLIGDPYAWIDRLQQPSWFQYLALERGGATQDYSDGLVPLWSSAIPGSSVVLPVNHGSYVDDLLEDSLLVRDYIVVSLNSRTLPLGCELTDRWHHPVTTSDGAKSWTFILGRMAPRAQDDVYPQLLDIGRINPAALNEAERTQTAASIGPTSAVVSWLTATEADSRVHIFQQSNKVGSPFRLVSSFTSSEQTKVHSLLITDLKPNTTYYYSVAYSPDGEKILSYDPGDILPKPSFQTGTPASADIVVTMTGNDVEQGSLSLLFANLGGRARDITLTGMDFSAGPVPVKGYSMLRADPGGIPLLNLPTAVTVTYKRGDSAKELFARVNYTYSTAGSKSTKATTPWFRLK